MDSLEVVGAATHNLKGITLSIPKRQMVVITGVSGSGKSSLALDTIYQEGRLRYLESLSPYARQFVKKVNRPVVRAIHGISPTIAIDARPGAAAARSTVCTLSGLSPYLRLLMARAGEAHCPNCGAAIRRHSLGEMVEDLLERHSGRLVRILAPVARAKSGSLESLFSHFQKKGFLRVLVDGRLHYLDQVPPLDPSQKHDVSLLVDSVAVSPDSRRQLEESVGLAQSESGGDVQFQDEADTRLLSARLHCSACGLSLPEPSPATFSTWSAEGACPACRGKKQHALGAPCPECLGSGLSRLACAFRFHGLTFHQMGEMEAADLLALFGSASRPKKEEELLEPLLPHIRGRLESMVALNLGYLSLNRPVATLSGGERQRTRLVSQVGLALCGITYILDEPSIGLHMAEQRSLLRLLEKIKERGNTVILVEHDPETILAADYVVELGPGAGKEGGEVVYSGSLPGFLGVQGSPTADYLSGRKRLPLLPEMGRPSAFIEVSGISIHNLRQLDIRIPVGALTVVSGVSGSGKSSLVASALAPILHSHLNGERPGDPSLSSARVVSSGGIGRVQTVTQAAIGRNSRSCPATYLGVLLPLCRLFAQLVESRVRGYEPRRFSFNGSEGQCPSCLGLGSHRLKTSFLPDLEVTCPICDGSRYNFETLEVAYRGHSIAGVLGLTAAEAGDLFAAISPVASRIRPLLEVGLGYLQLGQSALRLSGGESQRIKLARELALEGTVPALYVLDEPTIGLHARDIQHLLGLFRSLLECGHTIVVVEHSPLIIRAAQHLIDLGPGGGREGGRILYQGPVSGVGSCPSSLTGRFLVEMEHGF